MPFGIKVGDGKRNRLSASGFSPRASLRALFCRSTDFETFCCGVALSDFVVILRSIDGHVTQHVHALMHLQVLATMIGRDPVSKGVIHDVHSRRSFGRSSLHPSSSS